MFREGDDFSQEEVEMVNDILLQRSLTLRNYEGRKLSQCGTSIYPYDVSCGDNKCFSMCGYGCQCWSWVCGDCCCHEGCQYHDYYCTCKGMWHRRCWGFHDVWARGCA